MEARSGKKREGNERGKTWPRRTSTKETKASASALENYSYETL
jgi:hypothetical protein